MKQEIEILFSINQTVEEAAKLLVSLGASDKGSKHTVDEYFYNTATKQFSPNDKGELTECLRIRTAGEKIYYTYKDDKFLDDGSWSHSDEYELEITDGETMKQALLRQHYQPLVTIDSHKTKYQWEDYEFTLEEVKDLGAFLEVEYTTGATTPIAAIKDEIRTLVNKLGFRIGEELTAGKPELLLNRRNPL